MEETIAQQLLTPKAFSHEIFDFEIIETHISWVILTGHFAYKIKKPVDFGFVDYTTLEKRKAFCELELKLNKRLTPQLYLEVLPITQGTQHPEIGGQGPIVDYALKMVQFEQSRLLSNVQHEEGLSKAIIQSLANQIALFHQEASVVPNDSPYGSCEHIIAPVRDNFKTMLELKPSQKYAQQIKSVEVWAEEQFESLNFLFKRRKEQDHIKVCHGDIHLGNIVLLDGTPRIFDAIEFNDDFRFLDTLNDMAFLCMDLEHKGYQELSNYFANLYFEYTGDFEGALLLNFYKAYRAMVRAKVSVFQLLGLSGNQVEQKKALEKDIKDYLDLALSYQQNSAPQLTITYGPSGSGKSVYTEMLMTKTSAIRLRSDVIRKQLFNLEPYLPCPESLKSQVYSEETTQKVYQTLSSLARTLLSHQLSVIIDATCLKGWQRALFFNLSQEVQVKFAILVFNHEQQVLETRLKNRSSDRESSDADIAIMQDQLLAIEPLTEDEVTFATQIN